MNSTTLRQRTASKPSVARNPKVAEADWQTQLKQDLTGLTAAEQREKLVPGRPLVVQSGEPIQLLAEPVQRDPDPAATEAAKPVLKNPLFAGDAKLTEILEGKATLSSGKGAHITKVQQGLLNLDFDLPRFGADGDFGGETRKALKGFQSFASVAPSGVLNQATMKALDQAAPSQPLKPRILSNPMFAGDTTLQEVADGKRRISKGSGAHIKKVQNALMNMGFDLPVYGADGSFGGEMANALGQFQSACGLFSSKVLDRGTMYALDQANTSTVATKYLRYDELFKDGLLDTTVGVGYDEDGYFDSEIRQIKTGLVSRLGLVKSTEAKAKQLYTKAGVAMPSLPVGEFYIKEGALTWKSNKVDVIVRLVTYADPSAKQAFLEAMQNSDVAIYTGHGRYGSGPDFDHKKKGDGNIWINPNPTVKDSGTAGMYNTLKNQGAKPNELQQISFDKKYKVWFFDGCNTSHYMTSIRKNATLTPEKLDVFGWGMEVGTDTTDVDVLTFIEGLIKQQSAQQIIENLNTANRVTNKQKGLHGEGLGDNPSTK
ncbi:MAG: peptidoglycan-binding protein [Bradymonadales bacterium]|nr:peptidoglycan-binding protein [Bradymonadales bacterium]